MSSVATIHVASKVLASAGRKRLALTLILVGGRIEVTRRTLATTFPPVTMTSPDGSTRTITLNQTSPGLGLGVIDVDKPGLYRFDDGTLHTVAASAIRPAGILRRARPTEAEAAGRGLGGDHAASTIPTPSSARCPAAPPAARTGSGSGATRGIRWRGSTSCRCCLMAIRSAWWRERVQHPSSASPPVRSSSKSADCTWAFRRSCCHLSRFRPHGTHQTYKAFERDSLGAISQPQLDTNSSAAKQACALAVTAETRVRPSL